MAEQVVEYVRRARAPEGPVLRDTFRENWWANHEHELAQLRHALVEPAAATAVAAAHFAATEKALCGLTDDDLETSWWPGTFNADYLKSLLGHDPPPTVRGLLAMAVLHLQDHAGQIGAKVARAF